MKRFSRALWLVVCLAASFGAPAVSVGQELPLEKSSTGTFTLEYAGQHFRVNASVPVKIRFELLSETQIKVSIVSESGMTGRVTVYWVEYQKYIYSGPIPLSEPWEGTLNTEGGFVDR